MHEGSLFSIASPSCYLLLLMTDILTGVRSYVGFLNFYFYIYISCISQIIQYLSISVLFHISSLDLFPPFHMQLKEPTPLLWLLLHSQSPVSPGVWFFFFFFLPHLQWLTHPGLPRTLLALALHVPRPGSPLSPKQWEQLVDLVTPSQDLFLQRSSYLLHF